MTDQQVDNGPDRLVGGFQSPGSPAGSGTSTLGARIAAARLGRFSGLGLLLVMIVVFGAWIPETFLTSQTLRSIAQGQAITLVLSLSLLVALSAGAFDLSVGQNMGLGAVVCLVLISQHGWHPLAACLATVAVTTAVGAFNALLVVVVGIDSFIATLGVGSILLAVSGMVSDNLFVGPPTPGFQEIASWEPLGVPVLIVYALAIAAMVWYVLEHTATGRRAYAVGANPEAARLAGISVGRYVTGAFVLAGLGCGVAAILLSASIGSVSPSVGGSYLLPAFAGCFFAATQIKPGRYNVGGLLVALALLGTGVKGLSLAGGQPWIPDLFNGAALIVAVGVTVAVQRHQERRSKRRAIAATIGRRQRGSAHPSDV